MLIGIMYINALIVTVPAATAVFQSIHWFVNSRKSSGANVLILIILLFFYCQSLKKV